MKARRFFAFVAGAAMLFGVSCNPDDKGGEADSEMPVITVSPESFATDLEGGEQVLTVTSNATWVVDCDQEDVQIEPRTGKGNGSVTVTLPAATTARSFAITFNATKEVAYPGLGTQTVAAEPASVSVYQNANASESVVTNVAEIRALLKAMSPTSTAAEVTAELAAMTLTGVLVAEPDGNLSNNKSIVIQDDSNAAGAGLTIYCTGNVSDDLEIGNIVNISLAGAKVQLYSGLLQVSNIAPNAIVVNGSTEVTPIEATLSNALDYESQYIKLNNVCPAEGVAGNVWNDTTSGKNVNFTTVDGVPFVIRVSGYASFKGETIPEKMGSICGVVGQYNGTFQFMPQYASDIQLTEDIVEPEADVVTIAQITEAGLYKVENAWVVATYTAGCLLSDASGAYILAYNPSTTPAVGTVLSIEGNVSAYNDVLQFGAGAVITATSETKSVVHPEATALNGTAIDAYFNAPAVQYATFTGVLTVSNNKYYNVAVDGATVIGSISNPNADLAAELQANDGAIIKATGYMIGKSTSSGKNYANMMAVTVEVDTTTPAIIAKDITGVPAAGVVDATADINVIAIESVTATPDGTVVTAASVTGNVLTYTVAANTGAARKGTITLSATGIEDVVIKVEQLSATTNVYNKVTAAPSDWSGTYLFSYLSGTTLQIAGEKYSGENAEKSTFTNITVSNFSGSTINSNEYPEFVIEKVAGTEYYTIKFGEWYVGWESNTGNSCQFKKTLPAGSESNYYWIFTLENEVVKINNVGTTERYLQYNASTPRFAIYKLSSNQNNLTLFKK